MIPKKACPGLDPGCEAVFGKITLEHESAQRARVHHLRDAMWMRRVIRHICGGASFSALQPIENTA
jgi:hypothetical protein